LVTAGTERCRPGWAGAQQPGEHLGEVPRMEHNQAHAAEDVPVDAFDDGVTHLMVGHMALPEQDIRLREHLLVEAVLIVGG
jgi:hypothetical protein